jgi:thiol:disulfide interchange protein
MKRFFSFLLAALTAILVQGQIQEPVKFKTELKNIKGAEAEIVFTGHIDSGWHVYSTGLPKDGPISATFSMDKADGVEAVGGLVAKGNEVKVYDKMFEMNLRYFLNSVQFVQKIKFTKPNYSINCHLEYGACNDQNCTPPTKVSFTKKGKADVKATADADKTDVTESGNKVPTANEAVVADSMPKDSVMSTDTLAISKAGDLWKPVIKELQSFGGATKTTDVSWLYIFFEGLIGGLLALLMPCIWPIIPMTVSFFLKRNKDKRKAIREAITYGVSIIVIYLALGLAITGIFGSNALNSLSTNAVFNIFLFLLLVIFAASFFGAFEITLPSSWSNSVDSKAEKTSGLISIFLMAFTLTLVSFSCTGPIIGFLLVDFSTTGSIMAPTIGMLGFAIALALPFTLFAMFPSWMKSMPKSGGWMNVIKVVLGFIELAFALKFLSVADLAYGWHILDRETFLALWIVIFGLLGFYLIGKIKFPHDDDDTHVGVTRFFLALISFAFTIYMIPGLWGAPLKTISAFSPPMKTQDFNLYKDEVRAKFDDYDMGMAYARQQGKPVMLDFTGYGCVNCRKMELAVWTDTKVRDIINNQYVLISLYVDDKTPLPQPMVVKENGKEVTLSTRGDKWSYLQSEKFGANIQPFYVLVDNNGMPLNKWYSYNEDVNKYVEFLQTGLDNYEKNK